MRKSSVRNIAHQFSCRKEAGVPPPTFARPRKAGLLILALIASLFITGRARGWQEDSESGGMKSGEPATGAVQPMASEAAPSGTLVMKLEGNLSFCVAMNESVVGRGAIRPRQERNAPLITTVGYKYQISATRKGSPSVIKLFESPVTKTTYMKMEPPPKTPPTPRIATPEDLQRMRQPFRDRRVPRWMPENSCITLPATRSFTLAEGEYDIYLGFDLLVKTGQWVPLVSDYVSGVVIRQGRETGVQGTVDYTGGIRTVKLEPPGAPRPAKGS